MAAGEDELAPVVPLPPEESAGSVDDTVFVTVAIFETDEGGSGP